MKPFPIGQVRATPSALDRLDFNEIADALNRHRNGDWGDLDDEDKRANDEALHTGARLLSAYHAADGTKFWIITEADRSSTTVLLPDEY